MSNFWLLRSEDQEATAALATQFSTMPGSATERPLDERRLEYLHGQIMTGQVTTFSWATATRESSDAPVRINGQHTSTLMSRLDGQLPKGLMIHIDHYGVKDEHGEIDLFRKIDSRQAVRGILDVSGAYQNVIEALRNTPRATAKKAVDGIAWHLRHIVGLPRNGDEVFDLFHDSANHDFIIWFGRVYTEKTPELAPVAVVGAIYATFERDPDVAKAFWQQVARTSTDDDDQAHTTVLDGWLREVRKDKKLKSERVKEAGLYQGCVFAWNSMRANKPIDKIKYNTNKGFFEVE